MARIRTIKPEFPQSETIGRLSRDARLLFVQLWTIADDSGRARAASRMLASLLYPYDDDAAKLMPRWLEELEREGCILLYEAEGSHYLQIQNWSKHQKVDKPSPSRFPEPPENIREGSRESREASPPDLGPRTSTKDLGPRTKDQSAAPAARTPRDELREVLDDVHADAVLDHRKRKRAPLTAHAAKLLAGKFAKCADPNAAADVMVANGWQGFEPEWMENRTRGAPGEGEKTDWKRVLEEAKH